MNGFTRFREAKGAVRGVHEIEDYGDESRERMYAIIRSGGKQYRVEKGHTITVEKMIGDVGTCVKLREVLLLNVGKEKGKTVAGKPLITGACVHAEIVLQDRLPKIRVFKKKRRKNYRRTFGHRQRMTWLRVYDIEIPADMFPNFPEESTENSVASTMIKSSEGLLEKKAAGYDPGAESARYQAVQEILNEKDEKILTAKTAVARQDP